MSFRAYYHDAPDRLTVANKTRVLIQFTKISSLPILVLTEKKLFRNIVPMTYHTKYILLFNIKLRFTHQHMNALTFSNIQLLSYFAITWLTCGLMSIIIRPSFWSKKHFCICNLCEFRLAMVPLRATQFLFDLKRCKDINSCMDISKVSIKIQIWKVCCRLIFYEKVVNYKFITSVYFSLQV